MGVQAGGRHPVVRQAEFLEDLEQDNVAHAMPLVPFLQGGDILGWLSIQLSLSNKPAYELADPKETVTHH